MLRCPPIWVGFPALSPLAIAIADWSASDELEATLCKGGG
jgi:hypothetical protein